MDAPNEMRKTAKLAMNRTGFRREAYAGCRLG
jgi:hypothetical protein